MIFGMVSNDKRQSHSSPWRGQKAVVAIADFVAAAAEHDVAEGRVDGFAEGREFDGVAGFRRRVGSLGRVR